MTGVIIDDIDSVDVTQLIRATKSAWHQLASSRSINDATITILPLQAEEKLTQQHINEGI